ncbi:MAG: hypothetical protein ACM3PT_02360 [Deltaproteobacteria bacterium]
MKAIQQAEKILFSVFILISINLNAQKQLWSLDVSKNSFFKQLEDGKIFVKEENSISLIDNTTGKSVWKNNLEIDSEPLFLDNLPIMYFDGKSFAIIDATNGEIISKSNIRTKILDINYYWEKHRIILEMSRDNKLVIFSLDLKNFKNSFTTEIGEVEKELFGLSESRTLNKPSLTDNGSIILVDKKYVTLVSNEGKITKRIEFKDKIKKVAFNEFKNILYILEDEKKLHFVNITNGNLNAQIKVSEDGLELNLFDNGSILSLAQEKYILFLDAETGTQLAKKDYPDKVLSVFADNNKLYVSSKKTLDQLNPADGSVINTKSFNSYLYKIYKIKDFVFIQENYNLNLLDLNTLNPFFKYPVACSEVNNFLLTDQNYIFLGLKYNEFSLCVVDKNGNKKWNIKFPAYDMPSVDIIKNGLFIMNDANVFYFDINTGKSLWNTSITKVPSFTYLVDEDQEKIFMYNDNRIFIFDTKSGQLKESKDVIRFKDFDYESQKPQIMSLTNSLFIKGSNSVFVTDLNGNIKYSKDYPAISSTSGLVKLATVAVTVAAIGTGHADKVLTVYSGDNMVHKGGMVDGLNNAWDIAEQMKADRQNKQNQSSYDFPFVLTKNKQSKKCLMFLNPENGNERFDIELDESDPNFIVDEIDGVLFYLNKTSLSAYNLK